MIGVSGFVVETNLVIGICQKTPEKGSFGMKRLLQLLIGLSLVWAITSHGADVLRFRGENSQGIFNETGLLKSWPEEGLTPLWT